jgi:arylsulfatase A-like enzyme
MVRAGSLRYQQPMLFRGFASRVGAAALSIATLASCSAEPPAPPPNLLVVTLDTVRADHLSAYGYERDTSPQLARLASEGVRFALAYSAASTTLPSHASLFTGQPPIEHGVRKNGLALGEDAHTLAERMRDAGAQTAAIVSSFVLDRRFGLAQGFDHYEDDFTREGSSYPVSTWRDFEVEGAFDRRANETTDRAIRWLDEKRDPARPFFLFLHYFDPHDPYVPPEPWKSRFERPKDPSGRTSLADALIKRDLVDAYDGEIAFTDDELGRLFAHLEKLGLTRDTLVVVTADHGEGMGQHGVIGHGVNIYEEAVHVPLILRWPARLPAGRVIEAPIESMDVLPTLLELLGLASNGAIRGSSLAGALLRDDSLDSERPVVTHRRPYDEEVIREGRRLHGELIGMRRGRWKWIEGTADGSRELYDLETDPGERLNLADREAERSAALSEEVRAYRAEHERAAPAGRPADELDEDARERLRALGYAD